MKKIIGLFTAIFFCLNLATAQSPTIALTSYKTISYSNGKWGEWPTKWISYASEGRTSPEIQITLISEKPYVYNLRYYTDGEKVADFDVTYDSEKSVQIRKAWDTKFVNCYADENGDYIYVQGSSLDQLYKNVNFWASNADSKIYMFLPNQGYGVLVK